MLQARKKSMASEKPKLITSHNQNSFLEKKVLKENLPKKLRMVSHPHYHPQRQELHQQAEQEGMEL